MSLIKYRAFVTVVEQGSLTKAAKLLGYSQPGIGKMIDSLEKDFNLSLFTRNGSALEVNDNGKIVYAFCRDLVNRENDMINAVNAINGLITGTVRIGAINSLIISFLPQLLKLYSSAYSNIQISLEETSFASTIEGVLNGSLDIGFSSEFQQKGLEFIPLFKDPCRLVVSTAHPFAAHEKISISRLNGCEMIMVPPGGDDVIAAVKRCKPFSPVVRYYIRSDVAALAMVSSNYGAYIISELQCQHLDKEIKKIEFEEDAYRTMGIVVKSQKKASPAIKELIRIAKQLGEKY